MTAVSSLANQTSTCSTPSDALSWRPAAIARAVLPTPPGPTISTSLLLASKSDTAVSSASRPTSSTDIDGRFPTGASRAEPSSRRGGHAQRRVVGQDLLLELLQLQSRVEAELVRQPSPDPLVRGERIGLAAVAVQGDHQQRPEALAQRMHVHQRFELADHRSARHRDRAGRPTDPR